MDPYYAWVTPVPGQTRVTIIAAMVPALGTSPIPLLAQQSDVVDRMFRPIAEAHAKASSEPVWKVKLVEDPDFEVEQI